MIIFLIAYVNNLMLRRISGSNDGRNAVITLQLDQLTLQSIYMFSRLSHLKCRCL